MVRVFVLALLCALACCVEAPRPAVQPTALIAAPATTYLAPLDAAHAPKIRLSPDEVSRFARVAEMLAREAQTVHKIYQCRIRSFAWAQPLEDYYLSQINEFAKEIGVSTAQKQAGINYASNEIASHPNAFDCGVYWNSSMVDRLDVLQYRLTGGYH